MKTPQDVFDEFLATTNISVMCRELIDLSGGKWLTANSKVEQLRRALVTSGISPNVANSLATILIESKAVELIANSGEYERE